jgi:predicted ATPase
LAARIDRLAPEDKRLLQTAAVIGTEVPFTLLRAIADVPEAALHRGLAHLQAAEFLYETRLFPEQEYSFKHALTHEVAYGSLLLERRRGLHARLVEAFEVLAPERVDEQVERLAHHALRGEVWGKAVPYCRQAGTRAYDCAAFHEAIASYDQALQALDLARQHRERADEALALHQLGVVQAHAAPPDAAQAESYYQQALALAEELGMRPLQAHCHRGLGMLYATTGQRDQAHAALTTALALYRVMDMTFWLPETEAALAQVDT